MVIFNSASSCISIVRSKIKESTITLDDYFILDYYFFNRRATALLFMLVSKFCVKQYCPSILSSKVNGYAATPG